MQLILTLGVDIVAVSVMVLGVYFRRHRRRDMLLAYMSLNVGVMAVTLVLANASVAAGLGLGLFGVLSIIRLRSSQLTQEEVAYYFASLASVWSRGCSPTRSGWPLSSVSLLVAVMYGADHPRLHAQSRQQIITSTPRSAMSGTCGTGWSAARSQCSTAGADGNRPGSRPDGRRCSLSLARLADLAVVVGQCPC